MTEHKEGKVLKFKGPLDKLFPESESLAGELSPEEMAEADKEWERILKEGRKHAPDAMNSVGASWDTKKTATHLGIAERTTRNWVNRGLLLGIKLRGVRGYRYPIFQFASLPRLKQRSLLPEVTEIRQVLNERGMDSFTQAQFFFTESPVLGDMSPLEIIKRRGLLEKIDDVKKWVKNGYGEMGS